MIIAQPTSLGNPSDAPAGTPQHHLYWQERLVIESSRAKRVCFPRNPQLEASLRSYWAGVFPPVEEPEEETS